MMTHLERIDERPRRDLGRPATASARMYMTAMDGPRLGLAQPDGHPAIVAGETVEQAAVRVELAEEQVERAVLPITNLDRERIDDVRVEAADELARRMRLA